MSTSQPTIGDALGPEYPALPPSNDDSESKSAFDGGSEIGQLSAATAQRSKGKKQNKENKKRNKRDEGDKKARKDEDQDPRQRAVDDILRQEENNYEGILGAERSDTEAKKLAEYKRRAFLVHPDQNKDQDEAHQERAKTAVARTFIPLRFTGTVSHKL